MATEDPIYMDLYNATYLGRDFPVIVNERTASFSPELERLLKSGVYKFYLTNRTGEYKYTEFTFYRFGNNGRFFVVFKISSPEFTTKGRLKFIIYKPGETFVAAKDFTIERQLSFKPLEDFSIVSFDLQEFLCNGGSGTFSLTVDNEEYFVTVSLRRGGLVNPVSVSLFFRDFFPSLVKKGSIFRRIDI